MRIAATAAKITATVPFVAILGLVIFTFKLILPGIFAGPGINLPSFTMLPAFALLGVIAGIWAVWFKGMPILLRVLVAVSGLVASFPLLATLAFFFLVWTHDD
jgi:hypothetical protein